MPAPWQPAHRSVNNPAVGFPRPPPLPAAWPDRGPPVPRSLDSEPGAERTPAPSIPRQTYQRPANRFVENAIALPRVARVISVASEYSHAGVRCIDRFACARTSARPFTARLHQWLTHGNFPRGWSSPPASSPGSRARRADAGGRIVSPSFLCSMDVIHHENRCARQARRNPRSDSLERPLCRRVERSEGVGQPPDVRHREIQPLRPGRRHDVRGVAGQEQRP